MVFKGRFFSSSKKSSSSSPDGSGSPRTPSSSSSTSMPSSSRSDKKSKSSASDRSHLSSSAPRHSLFRDAAAAVPSNIQNNGVSTKKDKDIKDRGKKDSKCKETDAASASFISAPAKLNKVTNLAPAPKDGASASAAALPPILASSLGLNRIKTRSGPLPQEGHRTDGRMPVLGSSTLSRNAARSAAAASSSSVSVSAAGGSAAKSIAKAKNKDGSGLMRVPEWCAGSWPELSESSRARDQPAAMSAEGLLNSHSHILGSTADSIGKHNSLIGAPEDSTHSAIFASEMVSYDACGTPKESESPRFKEIMQATSAPRKRCPGDIKSFSHELNSKGVRPFPVWKPRSMYNLKEVLKVIQSKFEKAKEEVNSDLEIFAGELVGIMEKNTETHPEWKETLEDLLLLARSCCVMTPGEFWLQCECIVQDLDDRRQELPMGVLKKLYTRLLFILTRCTRLLQFHKESGFAEDEFAIDEGYKYKQSADGDALSRLESDSKGVKSPKRCSETSVSGKAESQKQRNLKLKRSQELKPVDFFSHLNEEIPEDMDSPARRECIASWRALPSPVEKHKKESLSIMDGMSNQNPVLVHSFGRGEFPDAVLVASSPSEVTSPVDSTIPTSMSSKHQSKLSWGYWTDQQTISEDGSIMCRICEEYVPTQFVENHSKICTVADRCDKKGLTVDKRLIRIAETLEKMVESYSQKDQNAVGSPDTSKISSSSITEESDILSSKLSDWSRHNSADMLDGFHEIDNSMLIEDLKNLPPIACKTRFGPKSDQGMTTSSAGSLTPRSPLTTPKASHMDGLLAVRNSLSEVEDLPQINELADIARCIANTPVDEERSLTYLVSCLEDLQEVMNCRKLEALTVQTFGTRIEKLHREKYLHLCDLMASHDREKVDTSTMMEEEEDVVHSLRSSPVHPCVKDRTSIDDFEIIKPISRGAFGRVFLAKKRTTGDLFAIKVLKKADMIRKNAVESILAERDILITVRNPFVVRFFYSFTSRENLYLVMEYLNGGDLYSLLRNLGCLDENVARIYIAEVVLALEYIHSLCVVHRDLKPDNLLIAHDGHIKLTDFGLSKVGLINSTDDLSGPAVSGASLDGEDDPQLSISENLNHRERRQKRSAVGTPDYLAPEILLGTGHGASADWWSVGVILFELIVGIPPFNAEHPQTIFDNILNRKIPWPRVPEEMSFEARDLIDKLLTEDPHQRLGAKGASEVKQHPFFKDINWDTLARQKAAFVPSSDSPLDTSYFTSRYCWSPSDEQIYEASEPEDSSENGSISGSSSGLSNHHDELDDECGGLAEFDSGTSVNYSFSNFSFKNLSQLASINYDLLTKSWKDDRPEKPGI